MRVPTSEAASFKRDAGWIAKDWGAKQGWVMPAPDTKVVVRMWVYWKSNQRRDADNVLKVLLDSLKGVLFCDDNMCLPQVMDFSVDKSNPRIELEIEVKGESVNA